MMEQGCLHLPGRATIKATEYRELIEDRLNALNLLAEKNRELEEAKNRLEAKEERIEHLKMRLQRAGEKLEDYERFFCENHEEAAEFGVWKSEQEAKRAAEAKGAGTTGTTETAGTDGMQEGGVQ